LSTALYDVIGSFAKQRLAINVIGNFFWWLQSISGTYVPVLALLAIHSSRRPSIDCSHQKKSLIAICIILFTLSPALAATLIIEPEMGREPIVNEINKAKQSVNLVMYNLTDKTMLNALLQQQAAGRTVQVILEKTPFRTTDINKKTISKLKRANIAWLGKVPDMRFIHQKTLLIDNREAMVMTFNFTHSTFKKQRNFAIILDNPVEVNDIKQHFNADWNGTRFYTPTPDLIWSPDNSRRKIIELINNAKQELHIYAQSISDKQIISALEKAATRGVKITVLTSSKLSIAGVTVIHSNHYYIHAKVFIIDNQTGVIGSINLTKTSLDQNRELSVITHDPAIIGQLQTTFKRDCTSPN
jgi:cardiolipin synthase A/B